MCPGSRLPGSRLSGRRCPPGRRKRHLRGTRSPSPRRQGNRSSPSRTSSNTALPTPSPGGPRGSTCLASIWPSANSRRPNLAPVPAPPKAGAAAAPARTTAPTGPRARTETTRSTCPSLAGLPSTSTGVTSTAMVLTGGRPPGGAESPRRRPPVAPGRMEAASMRTIPGTGSTTRHQRTCPCPAPSS